MLYVFPFTKRTIGAFRTASSSTCLPAVPVHADMGTTGRSSLYHPLLLPMFFFVFMTHRSMATDTLSLGQSLYGGQTIISKSGRFELGFFSPGLSRNYYIGIWFKEVPETAVWVANRQAPLPDASSELKISENDGNLVLINYTNVPTWSSSSTSKILNPTAAVLLDSGNLVLRDSSNPSIVFWQSFDNPTDTWLPGARFGLNKVTGIRQRFISWKNSEDPAPGAFSIQIEDGTSRYIMLWNESQRYWSSRVWDGRKFAVLNNLGARELGYVPPTLNFTFITNKIENSSVYSFEDNSTISRVVMESSGQFKIWIWSKEIKKWVLAISLPGGQCEVYNLCGSFGVCNENSYVPCTCLPGFRPLSRKAWKKGDWSGGCVREADISCSANGSVVGRSQEFIVVPNIQLPMLPQSLMFKGAEECQIACLGNCSCTAYAYNTSGCYQWIGDLLNLRRLYERDVREDLYLRVAVQSRADKRGLTRVVVACSVGVVVFLGVIFVLCWIRRSKLQFDSSGVVPGSLVPYRYRDLRIITHDFSKKLGGGSFGSVYKGTSPDSSLVAVKKLESLRQGEKEFRSEISTVGMIQHANLVRLLGFCSEGSKRLLVYEFMPNGSLASYMFGKNSRVVDWKTRYQIALDIAKGLAYLHEECRECIVHCDIKPENILLDAAFCPKIADFGMAKLIGRDFSRVLTTMRGTMGYLAPEWIQGVAITAKTDVYSYGMMLFEIVSGSRNTRRSEIADGGYFPLWAVSRIKQDDAISILDTRLEGNADNEELNRACRVASWCIQEDEASRPSMGEIVNILEGGLEVNMPPLPRFLQILLDNQDMVKSETGEQG